MVSTQALDPHGAVWLTPEKLIGRASGDCPNVLWVSKIFLSVNKNVTVTILLGRVMNAFETHNCW